MRSKQFCVSFLAFCAIAALAIASTVSAQELPEPPQSRAIDQNGIDLVNLESLGPNCSIFTAGISRTPTGRAPKFDNFMGYQYADGLVSLGPDYAASATANGTTVTTSGNLSTMKTADGQVAIYDSSMNSPGAGEAPEFSSVLVQRTKADGEILKYYYKMGTVVYSDLITLHAYTLNAVTSSLGWTVKYELNHTVSDVSSRDVYTLQKAYIVNSSLDYCDPLADSCAVASSRNAPTQGTGIACLNTSPNGIYTPPVPPGTSIALGTDHFTVARGSSVWTYDRTGGNTTTVKNPDGTKHIVTYGVVGTYGLHLLTDTDELLRKTTYVYYATTDAASGAYGGAVKQIIQPDATYSGAVPTGGFTQYKYDVRGNILETRVVAKSGYNLSDIVTSATYNQECNDITWKYCNSPLTTTDTSGAIFTYTYDSNSGSIASVTSPPVNGVSPQTRYTYAQYTPYVLTGPSTLTASPAVWRLSQTSTCMSGAAPSCVGTANELKTIYSYGTNNVLVTSVTTALGNAILTSDASPTNIYQKVNYSYDSNGNVIVIDGTKPGPVDETYIFYDAGNRSTGSLGMDADGAGIQKRHASRITYNDNGTASKIESGTAGAGTSAFYSGQSATDRWAQAQTDWDAMSVLSTDTFDYDSATAYIVTAKHLDGSALSSYVQTSYDNRLRTDCVAKRLNPAIYNTNSMPLSACSLATTGSDGNDRILKNYYDATGAQVSSVSGFGTSTPITNYTKSFSLSNGTLTNIVDGKGNITAYYYDGFNRLYKTCYANASNGSSTNSGDCETITFDGFSRVSTLTLRDGSAIGVTYDALGRQSTKTGAVSEIFTYDNFGQLLSHTNNTTGGAALTESYTYNAMRKLLSDIEPMGTVGYGYDSFGRQSKLTYPGSGLYLTYTYNDGDQLTSVNENETSNLATYTYDSYGRPSVQTLGNGYSTTLGYDANFRVSTLTSNAAGLSNKITLGFTNSNQIKIRTQDNNSFVVTGPTSTDATSFTNDGLNRISAVNSSSFGYDPNGNLQSDGAGTYVYNANNLLLSATQSNVTSSLTYDAANRLFSISKNGATTKFLYDGSDLIAEYDGAGILQRRYVFGPGTDTPLVWYAMSGGTATKYYFQTDERGSIVGVSNSSGVIDTIYGYDAFGNPVTLSGSLNSRFRYTGQAYLPEVGLYYYKARMYAPSLGRFMQTDPTGFADGLNWYNYAQGDPINGSDPSGTLFVPDGYGGGCNIHHFEDVGRDSNGKPDQSQVLRDYGYSLDCFASAIGGVNPGVLAGQMRSGVKSIIHGIQTATKSQRDAVCSADFYTFSLSFGELAQGSGTVTADKFGHLYFSGGIGGALQPGAGWSFGAYKMIQTGEYTGKAVDEERINGFVTGWGITGSAVAGGGGSFSANGSGAAYGVLVGTPSLDATLSWTNEITSLATDAGFNPTDFVKQLNGACGR